ncbi:penicillin-binding protein activator LpoB [candidate division KSB3 bacterium]|uniref:Penicillin-binding protein activator LpoB n=1 Tax=candidate division KSB3 bacterium TaxID=2044937 RepID=A0A2G6E945_9BACT|nr:MAG: penicillin-binding protein activator LpoB [candidate division KSB3 bacterium]PIE29557.1 MAG: penicillin-binding protein activator LpoB [candidate division KSB3 bacterium]
MKNIQRDLIVCIATVVFLAGCGPLRSKVYRIDPEKPIDLSGRWNDSDSQMVSEEMIAACMNDSWAEEFTTAAGKLPVVLVGSIYNKTDEHISSDLLISDLEQAFIESRRAKVIQSGAALDEIRAIRQSQLAFTAPETRRFLREYGANFIMQGKINKIADIDARRELLFYQVELELIDIETVEKVWIGRKKIKKYVERPRYGF